MQDLLKQLMLKLPKHLDQSFLEKWLKSYLEKKPVALPVDTFVFKTEFMKRANLALLDIPWGETITYQELAKRIGCKSSRAIGMAMAKNPYPLLLPCHRVVPKAGGIGGYAFGSELKEKLLQFESQ